MAPETNPHTQLDDLLRIAGESPAEKQVQFSGSGSIYPVTLRIGELAGAAIAAGALQAARLWQLKTGRGQDVEVDLNAAAEAMRGHRYIRQIMSDGTKGRVGGNPGQPAPAAPARRNVAIRMFRTRDGRWMYFRSGFKHHADAVAGVLGCEYEDELIERAVAGWDGEALEDAVTRAGGCGCMVRSYDEWAAHPHGRAIAAEPLFTITKIGDSKPEPMPDGDRPLSGIKVLDLTRVLAGPACARTLAEHGAQVLRLSTDRYPEVGQAYTPDTGHGKRSTNLDLRTPQGVETAKELVRSADVWVQGYRPGTFAARGLGPEDLAALRPGTIYVSISAFGPQGPWSHRRGFGSITACATGLADECSDEAGVPRTLLDQSLGETSPEDFITGYAGAFAAMAALARRAREGGSYHVQLSIGQTAYALGQLPRLDPAEIDGVTGDLRPDSIESFMTTSETPYGKLWHMGPVARMSETQPRWAYPTVPLDHDEPVWL